MKLRWKDANYAEEKIMMRRKSLVRLYFDSNVTKVGIPSITEK
jgi:hypothetical protein